MRKSSLVKLTIQLLTVAIAGFFFASKSFAGISGTMHDFSNRSWNSEGEVCNVCHTPHKADTDDEIPLWNHKVTNTTFALYESVFLDTDLGQPSGVSKACLSCHDGTVAVDAYGSNTGGQENVVGDWVLGTDLSNDHPVSFTYDTALANTDGALKDPDLVSEVQDLLVDNKLECASCHDVHNTKGVTSKLLVKSNQNSALCLTCHIK